MLAGPADAVEGNAFLKFGVVILAALAALPVFPAQARATVTESAIEPRHDGNIPVQLGEADRARYRAIFAALHNEQWTEAKNLIELGDDDKLRPVELAELYLDKHGRTSCRESGWQYV